MEKVLFWGIAVLIWVAMLLYYGKKEHPVRTAVLSMTGGGLSLLAASWAAGMFGITIKLNLFTAFLSLTLGVPGVSLMLLYEITGV